MFTGGTIWILTHGHLVSLGILEAPPSALDFCRSAQSCAARRAVRWANSGGARGAEAGVGRFKSSTLKANG